MARMPAATFQLRQNFLRIAKREIMEHHHMLLFVKQGFRRFAHNQRCRQKLLLLQSHMGMHPMGAGARIHKIIVKVLARLSSVPATAWEPRPGRKAGSIHASAKGFNIQIIRDPRLKPLPQHQRKPISARLFTMPKTFAARPLTSIIREAILSSVRRLRPGKACRERCGAKYPAKPSVSITSCSSQLTKSCLKMEDQYKGRQWINILKTSQD